MSTADLHSLVNPDRIRASVRRLFTGSLEEILGELFQNSQRAGAHSVTITTTPAGWIYADNGHGLLDGMTGFHTLLRLADTGFANPTVADQDPMGLGVHALLAHRDVQTVTFASGTLQLTIDPARWWTEAAYYATWFERLEALPTPVAGLHITVQGDPTQGPLLRDALTPGRRSHGRLGTPAQGYAGILAVTLDGQPVETHPPTGVVPRTVLVDTHYQGCRLRLGISLDPLDSASHYTHDSVVNWFGQLIPVPGDSPFHFYLEVRAGRPVTPQAPTRLGPIADPALLALRTFVREALFTFLTAPAHAPVLQAAPAWVAAAYRLDWSHACREFAFFTATPLLDLSAVAGFQDLRYSAPAQVFTYAAPPPLLSDGIIVLSAAPAAAVPPGEEYAYGLPSLAPLLGPQYLLDVGNPARLPLATLWWQPGPARPDEWHQPGVWGLSMQDDVPPTAWAPVTGTVCAFNDTTDWDVDYVDFVVGTTDPVAFYTHLATLGFDPHEDADEYEAEEQQAHFDETCLAHIRRLRGDTIARVFTLGDVQAWMPTRDSPITQIRYHFPRHAPTAAPVSITAWNRAGERKRLTLAA